MRRFRIKVVWEDNSETFVEIFAANRMDAIITFFLEAPDIERVAIETVMQSISAIEI